MFIFQMIVFVSFLKNNLLVFRSICQLVKTFMLEDHQPQWLRMGILKSMIEDRRVRIRQIVENAGSSYKVYTK